LNSCCFDWPALGVIYYLVSSKSYVLSHRHTSHCSWKRFRSLPSHNHERASQKHLEITYLLQLLGIWILKPLSSLRITNLKARAWEYLTYPTTTSSVRESQLGRTNRYVRRPFAQLPRLNDLESDEKTKQRQKIIHTEKRKKDPSPYQTQTN
jgi:hypothetical protein